MSRSRSERTGPRPGSWLLLALLLASPSIGQAEEDADGFLRADGPRAFEFPRDDASHPATRTEWWYLTGTLNDEKGDLFGLHATWFRSALAARPPARTSPLATRDLYFFHGAITDVARKDFQYDQRASRGAPGWAAADTDRLDVHVLKDRLEELEFADGRVKWRLRCRVKEREIDLTLESTRPPLFHGESPGWSRKGPEPHQSSYYYSRTRLEARGEIRDRKTGAVTAVRGSLWFDHEFGSDQLAGDQVGWDWFSVPLDDGSDLMLYLLRKRDGSVEAQSSGTLRTPDGKRFHLALGDFEVEVLDTWTSPETGGTYPSRWNLRVPSRGIELEVVPLLPGQELQTRRTTGVNYFEGLSRFRGQRDGKPVEGLGYVELVGYAGEFRQGI